MSTEESKDRVACGETLQTSVSTGQLPLKGEPWTGDAEESPAKGEPNRTIETVTGEIRLLHNQAQRAVLSYAIEIGRRLVEAKALVPHGGWAEYLKNEVDYSQSTAGNFMKIFEEYGASQQSLFEGTAKSQALGNLTYTKALALLALPGDERETFAETHDVEDMSTRELAAAIRAREEALQQARDAETSRAKMAEDMKIANASLAAATAQRESADQKLRDAAEDLEEAKRELEALRRAPVSVAVETITDEAAIKAAAEEARRDAETRLNAKIQKAEQAKQKAEDAKAAAEQALGAQKLALEQDLQTVEREKKSMGEQMEELRKKLAVASSSEMTIFKLHFEAAQGSINKLAECLGRMRDGGDETGADKMQGAFLALLEAAKGAVGG